MITIHSPWHTLVLSQLSLGLSTSSLLPLASAQLQTK